MKEPKPTKSTRRGKKLIQHKSLRHIQKFKKKRARIMEVGLLQINACDHKRPKTYRRIVGEQKRPRTNIAKHEKSNTNDVMDNDSKEVN